MDFPQKERREGKAGKQEARDETPTASMGKTKNKKTRKKKMMALDLA